MSPIQSRAGESKAKDSGPETMPHKGAGPDTEIYRVVPTTLAVSHYGVTHPGKVRTSNEDQFLIAELAKALQVKQTSLPQPRVQESQERGYLFVVADGMGGHAAGEHASALAINTLEHFLLDTFKWFFRLKGSEGDVALTDFRNALHQIDARLFEEVERHPELSGMGTTLTMAYVLNGVLFVAHVGDSRCYLLREGTLYRTTEDHTLVQELVRQGRLSSQEAETHHLRHVILNVVGGTEPGVKVEVRKLLLEPNDALLLCSDGLTEMVDEDEIARVLTRESNPRCACERLRDVALEKGGRDNVTVLVARFRQAEEG